MSTDVLLDDLSHIYLSLNLDSNSPLTIMPAVSLKGTHNTRHNPAQALLVNGINSQEDLIRLHAILARIYPAGHGICLFTSSYGSMSIEPGLTMEDLAKPREFQVGMHRYLFVPPLEKAKSFEEFQELIAHLRAPEGCPWDREQTHLTLRNNLLEETYETLEALDREDAASTQEEFGDLLLQIVLHAQIAAEAGEFTMEDVVAGIYNKIVRRHPHVFGEVEVDGVKNVLQNWEKLKEKERADKGVPEKGLLDGVPVVLPSLTQAQELQDRAARVGFDWPEIQPVWDKVLEELEEVRQAGDDKVEAEKELGDLLFAVVNLIRWYKVDSESALRATNQKFRRRFKHIEKSARSLGRDLQSMTLDEMDAYWNEAKGLE
jgi:tetrapyrrole methylase family protein/MazG family protein